MKLLLSKTEIDSKRSRDLIPLECIQCGNTHHRTKNTIQRILNGSLKGTNKGCFCSKRCGYDYRKISESHVCSQCGNEVIRTPSDLKGKNVFCNHSCAAIFHNKDKIIKKECLYCETTFRPKRGNRGLYCSLLCANRQRQLKIYEKIESGTYSAINGHTLREYMIKKYGAKCMECGWDKINPKSNKSTIQLEHIDGNSENNIPTNLKLLCPNCHSLTPTFGGLNRGSGRHYRRMRYASGKSS